MNSEETKYVLAWWNLRHINRTGSSMIPGQDLETAQRIVRQYEFENPQVARNQQMEWGDKA